MTFQPPPPPPPQGPPTPPPPPPGQWGPPPGQGPSGASSFDPKSVNNLDWGILGAGLLLFIFSFTSWYSYSPKGGCHGIAGCADYTQSAWSGFFGWFAVLLAIIGSAAVGLSLFMPHVKLPFPNRLIGLGAYALAAIFTILALFVVPDISVDGFSVSSSDTDTGHSFGYWISLIVVLAGVVLSLMRAQQTGTALPGPLGKAPKIGK